MNVFLLNIERLYFDRFVGIIVWHLIIIVGK